MTDIPEQDLWSAISTTEFELERASGRKSSVAAMAEVLDSLDLASPERRINLALKRVMDVVGSLVALTLLAPLLVAVAVAIRLESHGPVLFVQERWGKDRKRIRVIKFRSMHAHACDHTGIAQTVEGDERVTRLGAFLRKTNIDELPQLINVLRGDMSLVGPRCHVVGMQAGGMDYEALVPHYHLRHTMRPGLTGLAQMRGLRGPTSDPGRAIRRVHADLEYIVTFNVVQDIVICLRTAWHEVFGGGRGV